MANKLITSAMYDKAKLEHYGVKGMKWGVRRTPEQLGYKTKSKTQDDKEVNALLEDYLINIGISLAITAVAYGASNVGNKKVMAIANDDTLKITKLKQAKKIAPPESYLDSMKNTNNTRSINKNFKNNCPNTTLAYELRRRGYDVKAKPSPRGLTMSAIKDIYNIKESDIHITNMTNPFKTKENNQKMMTYFNSMPDGYRGAVVVFWDSIAGGGHIFNVEKVNGKIIFIDSQSGKKGEFKGASIFVKTAEEFKSHLTLGYPRTNPADYLSKVKSVEIFRTDNAIINETYLSDRILKG